MKRLMTGCAIVCMVLGLANISVAATVTAPPDAPDWWNSEDGEFYAYGWWSADIIGGGSLVSPPDNADHWATNFLSNTDFTAVIGIQNETVSIDLKNVFRQDLYKKVYVYITGTTTSTFDNIDTVLDTDGGVFSGSQMWDIGENGQWFYLLTGEIRPQPEYVRLTFAVPGMTDVTGIWAGEICLIPEPATMSLLGFGALSLIRRKKIA